MQKFSLIAGSLFGALAVMTGAFGAHALKAVLTQTNRLDTFETAVKYQFYHALALLLIGLLLFHLNHPALRWAAICFVGGILIFSGSLYILCLSGITWLGAITPIGGVLFIAGWVCLAYAAAKAL
ncbi:MAG TPA: DUF423 domain-containing protein [Adhaeribacter sp.]|nr:DUF423 domain-containing protein [Adhaeribacter sp.]